MSAGAEKQFRTSPRWPLGSQAGDGGLRPNVPPLLIVGPPCYVNSDGRFRSDGNAGRNLLALHSEVAQGLLGDAAHCLGHHRIRRAELERRLAAGDHRAQNGIRYRGILLLVYLSLDAGASIYRQRHTRDGRFIALREYQRMKLDQDAVVALLYADGPDHASLCGDDDSPQIDDVALDYCYRRSLDVV